ncbi:MAG: extracellular solute-binding protein [Deltaproteobacteria bacterium]|nr:extracellular solute-binding protein [Deltaproteobacteria bacterium]
MKPYKKHLFTWRFLAGLLIPILIFTLPGACMETKPQQKVLRVSFSLTEAEWEIFRQKIFPPFENRNHCRIEAVQIEAANLPKLLEVGKISGKSQIDLFAQDNMELALLVKKRLVEDLSEYADHHGKQIYPSLLDIGRFAGKLLFIPFRPNVQIFYYNKAKFEEYGLMPPQSWDEWLHCATVFLNREKVGRILIKGFGGNPTVTQIYEYIVSAGGDPFAFNDDGSKRTFLFFRKLWKAASPDSKKAKWDTSNDYFARDSVYLMQNWPFGYKIITEKYGKKDVGVYHGFPGPRKEAHVVGGDVFGIPVGSKNRDLALQFIQYMLSKEVQGIFVKDLSWPSARPDAYEMSSSPAFQAIREAFQYGVFRKNVPYWAEYQKLFEEAFVRIVIKGEDPALLDQFHDRMEKIKARYE